MSELSAARQASLSIDARALLEKARAVKHAVDLYLAPGATRVTADRLVEILHRAQAIELGERAAWNLFFAAGELSLRVDVYRAHDLFRGAAALVGRLAALELEPGDGRAVAAEMCFDFFFARPSHPLLPLRAREVIATLGLLLGSGRRTAVRAALHALGHLVALGAAPDRRAPFSEDAVAMIDDYAAGRMGSLPDAALAAYADEARTGAVR